jgi:hypothetical protein
MEEELHRYFNDIGVRGSRRIARLRSACCPLRTSSWSKQWKSAAQSGRPTQAENYSYRKSAIRYSHYYGGYETLTQNSAGDITFECETGKVQIFKSENTYEVFHLDDETKIGPSKYFTKPLLYR